MVWSILGWNGCPDSNMVLSDAHIHTFLDTDSFLLKPSLGSLFLMAIFIPLKLAFAHSLFFRQL
jgi:hypothetical protein